ncbi:MAG TPA: condensation domain-containing protein, partial [Archangium sp.]
FVKEQRITALGMPPPALSVLPEEELPLLESVMTGGEACTEELMERWASRGRRFINQYGPTEVSIASTSSLCTPGSGKPTLGRPFPNTSLYVLDERMQPVPLGVRGELYIGGIGVARGYLGRPELTAERFLPHPFSTEPGARLYRTGDLVRYRADGNLEFHGRTDSQVKIRGFRIELGELESVLSSQPTVQQTVVVAREDVPGDKRLVAYVVPKSGATLDLNALRAAIKEKLPDYMVPSAFVALQAMPMTANAKVDRKALPAPEGLTLETAYAAPEGELESRLATDWASLLGVARVGRHDDFFELGGHSLLATQIISRVRDTFGVELPLPELFEHPTVAGLAAKVASALEAGKAPQAPAVVPVPRGGPLPLSFAQERLWFLDQLEPGSALYNIPAAIRLEGALDVTALERSFGELVRRHEALRTTFKSHEGQPRQHLSPASPVALPVIDLQLLPEAGREAQLRERAADESRRPFDLAAGPLLRTLLFKVGPQEHVLLLTMHHIVSDGWSMGVLIREMAALYEAFSTGKPSPLPEPVLQYADYAAWQRRWFQGEALQTQLAYWTKQLEGTPAALELPTDHPRPATPSSRGASHPVRLPGALSESLKALGQREGATPFMVLLSAFQALLSRYSGQDDICVGTPIAGRRHAELEGMLGCFVNTL